MWGKEKKCLERQIFIDNLAETEGFEPSMRLESQFSLLELMDIPMK